MKLTDAIISPMVAFTLAVLAGLYGILKMIFTNLKFCQVPWSLDAPNFFYN